MKKQRKKINRQTQFTSLKLNQSLNYNTGIIHKKKKKKKQKQKQKKEY